MVEGGPFGRPAFLCGVGSVLDCRPLLSLACLGCRGAAVIGDSSMQGCRVSPGLLYYMEMFM